MPTNGPNASDNDTGTLAESYARTTIAGNQDGGTLADASAVIQHLTFTDADTGTLADAGTLGASNFPTDSDTATLSDEALAFTPLSDAYTLSDAYPISVSIDDGPEAVMTDSDAILAVNFPVTDTGTLAEDATLTTSDILADGDTGTLAEDQTLQSNDLQGADTATLDEQVNLETGGSLNVNLSDADAGTLTDAATVTGIGAPIDADDTATLTESAALSASFVVSDTGSMSEGALTLSGLFVVGEAAAMADTSSLSTALYAGTVRGQLVIDVRVRGAAAIGRG